MALAAIIDSEADVPAGIRDVDATGYPINRRTFRVSRSARNLAKARAAELVTRRTTKNGLVFYV